MPAAEVLRTWLTPYSPCKSHKHLACAMPAAEVLRTWFEPHHGCGRLLKCVWLHQRPLPLVLRASCLLAILALGRQLRMKERKCNTSQCV